MMFFGSPRGPGVIFQARPPPWNGLRAPQLRWQSAPPDATPQDRIAGGACRPRPPTACMCGLCAQQRRAPLWRANNSRSDCAVDDAWGWRILKKPTVGVVMHHCGRCRRSPPAAHKTGSRKMVLLHVSADNISQDWRTSIPQVWPTARHSRFRRFPKSRGRSLATTVLC